MKNKSIRDCLTLGGIDLVYLKNKNEYKIIHSTVYEKNYINVAIIDNDWKIKLVPITDVKQDDIEFVYSLADLLYNPADPDYERGSSISPTLLEKWQNYLSGYYQKSFLNNIKNKNEYKQISLEIIRSGLVRTLLQDYSIRLELSLSAARKYSEDEEK